MKKRTVVEGGDKAGRSEEERVKQRALAARYTSHARPRSALSVHTRSGRIAWLQASHGGSNDSKAQCRGFDDARNHACWAGQRAD